MFILLQNLFCTTAANCLLSLLLLFILSSMQHLTGGILKLPPSFPSLLMSTDVEKTHLPSHNIGGWVGSILRACDRIFRHRYVVFRYISYLFSRYFEPSQPQRITARLKTNFSVSPSYSAYKLSNHKISRIHRIIPGTNLYKAKHTYTNIKRKIFKELVPSVLPLLKKHVRQGHAGIVDPPFFSN